jgi:bifunctional UDP-N-acetylglucosamine pyrophosphorylase/glucosamine-1-phosphate N-acetyltransferase
MRVADPTGYGRILTGADGNFAAIVEERDASPDQRKINRCNSGVIFAKAASLFGLLDELRPNNSQGEYYLTDCLGLAVQKNLKVVTHECDDWQDFLGVNDRSQLAAVEKILVRRMIDSLMKSGVTFHNPESCHIEADCKVGVDSEIGSGVCLEGRTVIGRGCKVGSNVTLDDVELGDGAVIGAGSVVRNYVVNPGENIPPLSMIQ